jgi:hypothetical protein
LAGGGFYRLLSNFVPKTASITNSSPSRVAAILHNALVIEVEVLNDNESDTPIIRHMAEKLFERFKSVSRSTDADDGEKSFGTMIGKRIYTCSCHCRFLDGTPVATDY